jgi:hypothetical protein
VVNGTSDLTFFPRGKMSTNGKGEMEMFFVEQDPIRSLPDRPSCGTKPLPTTCSLM